MTYHHPWIFNFGIFILRNYYSKYLIIELNKLTYIYIYLISDGMLLYICIKICQLHEFVYIYIYIYTCIYRKYKYNIFVCVWYNVSI